MKEDFFKVRYTMYIGNDKIKRKKWTNIIHNKIFKHKLILAFSSIIMMCVVMNFFLIYQFIRIMETSLCY